MVRSGTIGHVKLVILGRDGILNEYRDDHVKSPEEWAPIKGAMEAVARLNHAGWHVVVATNQSGIGRGMIDMANINAVHSHMIRLAQADGGKIDAIFFCPHTPEDHCECRKPMPGMMVDIGGRYGVDLHHVPMVSDTLRDLQAAVAAGCEPHLVLSGRAARLDEAQLKHMTGQVPTAQVHRDLGAFAEYMLRRDHVADSLPGSLT
jgi:D-glycero-D-manno-heptose 1,7-bisphosphate phosphatase